MMHFSFVLCIYKISKTYMENQYKLPCIVSTSLYSHNVSIATGSWCLYQRCTWVTPSLIISWRKAWPKRWQRRRRCNPTTRSTRRPGYPALRGSVMEHGEWPMSRQTRITMESLKPECRTTDFNFTPRLKNWRILIWDYVETI